jgi:hypothetical protein
MQAECGQETERGTSRARVAIFEDAPRISQASRQTVAYVRSSEGTIIGLATESQTAKSRGNSLDQGQDLIAQGFGELSDPAEAGRLSDPRR